MKQKPSTLIIWTFLTTFFFIWTILVTSLAASEDHWLTDYSKALEKAKTENKKVLMDFTGSDWCGWCMKLHKEVFSQKEFV